MFTVIICNLVSFSYFLFMYVLHTYKASTRRKDSNGKMCNPWNRNSRAGRRKSHVYYRPEGDKHKMQHTKPYIIVHVTIKMWNTRSQTPRLHQLVLIYSEQRGFATTGGSYACMHSPWIAWAWYSYHMRCREQEMTVITDEMLPFVACTWYSWMAT
jgi:hypothetical protein